MKPLMERRSLRLMGIGAELMVLCLAGAFYFAAPGGSSAGFGISATGASLKD